jgi:hypothetical protein
MLPSRAGTRGGGPRRQLDASGLGTLLLELDLFFDYGTRVVVENDSSLLVCLGVLLLQFAGLEVLVDRSAYDQDLVASLVP